MNKVTFSILSLLFLISCKESIPTISYKTGSCVKERNRFVAGHSKDAFDIYKLKTKVGNGHHLYRYNQKGTRFYYKFITNKEIRARSWSTVECPDKKDLVLFKD